MDAHGGNAWLEIFHLVTPAGLVRSGVGRFVAPLVVPPFGLLERLVRPLVRLVRPLRLLVRVGLVGLFVGLGVGLLVGFAVVVFPELQVDARNGVRVAIDDGVPKPREHGPVPAVHRLPTRRKSRLHFGFLLERQRLSAVDAAVVADEAREAGFADFVELFCKEEKRRRNPTIKMKPWATPINDSVDGNTTHRW